MLTKEFDYRLPPELVAQTPASRRDDARLLAYRRETDIVEHCLVSDLPRILRPGTLMVFNDTKVIPARLYGEKVTGGKVEFLLLSMVPGHQNRFLALGKSKKSLRIGEVITLEEGLRGVVQEKQTDGVMTVGFEGEGDIARKIERAGVMPLPPYIKRSRSDPEELRRLDLERYQTVYARTSGAIAAPTAGLHFTPELLQMLDSSGIRRAFITLHVGVGTFQPVRAEKMEDHVMHAEEYEISTETAQAVNQAKREGRKILAVGTTSCRALEAACREGGVHAGNGSTDLFITPGYRFRIVDALMTNFHLPKSTLLMLVSAMVGREKLMSLYREAIEMRYRFFSYGDAMLIL